MSDDQQQPQDQPQDQDGHEGQVSELTQDAPEPISSGDSVAGQPEQESGEVDEGAQGPNAIPDDPTGKHPHTT